MRCARDRSAEIALGIALAAMLAVRAIHPSPVGAWQRVIGAVEPNGSGTATYVGKPVRLLSVYGTRPGKDHYHERASAYHVLILHPTPEVSLRESWSTSSRYSHAIREAWAWGDARSELRFESRYSPLLHSVTIGGRRYWLWRGNLFVVQFGDDGKPRVRQFHAHVREGQYDTRLLENAFMRAARKDPEIQRALRDLHNYPAKAKRRCPPRGWEPTRSL